MSALTSPEADVRLSEEIFSIIKPRLEYMRGFVRTKLPQMSVSQGRYHLPLARWYAVGAAGTDVGQIEIQLSRRGEWHCVMTRNKARGFWSFSGPREVVEWIEEELREGESIRLEEGVFAGPGSSVALWFAIRLVDCLEISVSEKRSGLLTDESRLHAVQQAIHDHLR